MQRKIETEKKQRKSQRDREIKTVKVKKKQIIWIKHFKENLKGNTKKLRVIDNLINNIY